MSVIILIIAECSIDMQFEDEIETVFQKLQKISNENGFVLESQIIDESNSANLSIVNVERLSKKIHDNKILIKIGGNQGEVVDDRSRNDYEKVLNKAKRRASSLYYFIDKSASFLPPITNEWKQLIEQFVMGNQYSLKRFVEMYSRNIIHIAYRFAVKYDLEIDDVIQLGLEGFISGVKNYNMHSHGVLLTYTTWHIRNNLFRRCDFHPIFVFPVHYKKKILDIYSESKRYTDLPVDDKIDFINRCFGIGNDESYFISRSKLCHIFKEQFCIPFDDIDQYTFTNEIENVIGEIDRSKLIDTFDLLFDKQLDEREAEILRMRFGIHNNRSYTLEEVGNVFKITRERVRQIELKAIEKLRRKSARELLIDFFNTQ
jgi:RNA polymerase primary sigma factor